MSHSHRFLSLAIATLATGCLTQGSAFTDILPDDRIEINLPLASTAAKDDTTKDWATYYLLTAEVTENVNGLIGSVLWWVDTITTQFPPSYLDQENNAAAWGPWTESTLDPVMSQLWVTYEPETDSHTWGLDRWPKEDEADAASTVVYGEVDPGATHDISSGRFQIDFDTIHELDPTEEDTGQFGVEYEIRADGVSAEASFIDFSADVINATYVYEQSFEGEGMMDLTIQSDLAPSEEGELETWLIRSRWQADGAGRSDVVVSGGDLGDFTAYVSGCWDSAFERVYYTDNYSDLTEGDEADCVYLEASYPE